MENGLVTLRDWLTANPVKSLALPALGCGNGSLYRVRIKLMLEQHFEHLEIDISVYLPA
jgi:hypothetical protein